MPRVVPFIHSLLNHFSQLTHKSVALEIIASI